MPVKCPKCEKPADHFLFQKIPLKTKPSDKGGCIIQNGHVFSCPFCQTAISVNFDFSDLAYDIAQNIISETQN